MPGVDAIAALTTAFEDASAHRDAATVPDSPVAAISWPAVPLELVRAAGLRPMVVRSDAALTPAADRFLEAAAFPRRIRQLVDAMLTGRLTQTACVLLPRTSEADYKCFLYLRELVRRGVVRSTSRILLFDLLQSTGPEVARHNAARTRALFELLGGLTGGASLERLHDEIARVNAARAALRRLIDLRAGVPRITGADVLPLIGAFWQLAPEVYAPLASAAAADVARRPPLERPRVLLLGAPLDGPTLHRTIEAHGAVVVAETGPWGVGAAGEDVAVGGDPFAAIAAKYQRDSWGPRTPVVDVRRWTEQALTGVDAVVVSLPPDDAVFGWDYPWWRDQLQKRGVPHVRVTHDPDGPITDADHERLAQLVRAVPLRLEARRG